MKYIEQQSMMMENTGKQYTKKENVVPTTTRWLFHILQKLMMN